MNTLRITALLIAAVTLVSCSESGSDPGGPGPVTVRNAVETVAITPTSATVVIGDPLQFSVTLRDAAGNILTGRSVTWTTSNASAATVSSAGLVTGVAPTTQSLTITATSEGRIGTTSIVVVSVAQFTQFTIGGGHTCGISLSRAAYCWGSNASGQLGTNGSTSVVRDTPQPVTGGLTFVSLFAGAADTCGITTSNTTYCWGAVSGRQVPTLLAGGVQFAEFVPGDFSMCGRTSANIVYCWGNNSFGELGDNTVASHSQPTPVNGGLQFVQVVEGSLHYCARSSTNLAYCWGDNRYGALGDGTKTNRSSPTPVNGGLQFIALDSSIWHTCGITTNGAAYCWGLNTYGQLGDNTTIDHLIPTIVAGGLQFIAISVGPNQTCARTTANATYCWGFNGSGLLGDNTTVNRLTPTQVSGGFSFVDVQTGWHTCGRTASNATYCWGGAAVINPVVKPTPVPAP